MTAQTTAPLQARLTPRGRARLTGKHALLVALSVLMLFPLVLTVSTTFKTEQDVRVNPFGLFSSFSTENIVTAWTVGGFGEMLDGGDPRDAVGADRTLRSRDEIPHARLQHEAQRVERPLDLLAGAAGAVAHPQPRLLPDGARQVGEVGGVLVGPEPAGASRWKRCATCRACSRSGAGRVAVTFACATATAVPNPSSANALGAPIAKRATASRAVRASCTLSRTMVRKTAWPGLVSSQCAASICFSVRPTKASPVLSAWSRKANS